MRTHGKSMIRTLTMLFRPASTVRLRRLGKAGFAFFAAKGLLWLFVPLLGRFLLG